jgi:hypothetical protein
MRKAIRLKVTLWIEGEDEPAHDFFKRTEMAVRDVIAAGQKDTGLQMTIKAIVEQTNEDDDRPHADGL